MKSHLFSHVLPFLNTRQVTEFLCILKMSLNPELNTLCILPAADIMYSISSTHIVNLFITVGVLCLFLFAR